MVLVSADFICTIVGEESLEQFQERVKTDRALAVFMADWCGPCRQYLHTLGDERIAAIFRHNSSLKPLYIDADEKPEFAV